MKPYDQYTPQEIEDLARECERLAEINSELAQKNAELWETIDCLVGALQRLVAFEDLGPSVLTSLRRIEAIARKELPENPLDSEPPF